jgi:hypothetical protein
MILLSKLRQFLAAAVVSEEMWSMLLVTNGYWDEHQKSHLPVLRETVGQLGDP